MNQFLLNKTALFKNFEQKFPNAPKLSQPLTDIARQLPAFPSIPGNSATTTFLPVTPTRIIPVIKSDYNSAEKLAGSSDIVPSGGRYRSFTFGSTFGPGGKTPDVISRRGL